MSLYYIDIVVRDAQTQDYLGALVEFRGQKYRANGTVRVSFPNTAYGSTAALEVSADGYRTYRTNLTLFYDLGATVYVNLESYGMRVPLTVLDSVSKAAIPEASVFVDANPVRSTDSSGSLSLSLSTGIHIVKVSKAGYVDKTVNISVAPGLVPQTAVELVKVQTVQNQIKVIFEPVAGDPAPTEGALVTLTSGARTESLATDSKGEVRSGNKFIDGEVVIVTANKAGWTTLNDQITVKGSGPYIFQMEKTVTDEAQVTKDPNLAPTEAVTPVSDQGIAPVDGTKLLDWKKPDPYEWIYPSNEFGKYFTSTQARMYIGNLFVDELNTVQFALQANQIPVYGYASRDFDAVGTGKALVQGQIMINFISEGYLYTLLKEYATLYRSLRVEEDPEVKDDLMWQKLYDQKRALRAELLSGSSAGAVLNPAGLAVLPSDGAFGGRSQEAILKDIALIQGELDSIAARRGASLGTRKQLTSYTTPEDGYINAVYLRGPFDIELEFEGAGRVVKRRLEQCYLGSNEQIMDQSGNGLMDTYSFIARRLR